MKKSIISRFIKFLGVGLLLATSISFNAFGITQSTQAAQGRWPSAVGLVLSGLSADLGFYCSGSLIAPQWVVTAAHCVTNLTVGQIDAVIGLYQKTQAAGSQRISISQIIVHPNYNILTNNADIALLKLASPSTKAPMAVVAGSSNVSGSSATITGWGALTNDGTPQNILRQGALPVINNSVCQEAYKGLIPINNSHICAGDGVGGVSVCSQDSGGPLIINIQGQDVLVGVASFSLGCGVVGYYSGFASIAGLMSFLQQYVSGMEFVEISRLKILSPIFMLLLES